MEKSFIRPENHAQIQLHNDQQRHYYTDRIKKTLLPVRTPYVLRHIREALSFGQLQPGEKVLDVGCGMGRHAFLLAEQGLQVEGLELVPFLVEQFKKFDNGQYNIPVHCADINDLPAELNESFDVVIGFFILHHLLDLEQSFQSIARALKPGGRVLFVEPNPYNPLYYAQILCTPSMRWYAEKGMINMRPNVMRRCTEKAGLTNLQIKRFGFFPPFLTNKSWGSWFERHLERIPIWRFALPFQIFMAKKDFSFYGKTKTN